MINMYIYTSIVYISRGEGYGILLGSLFVSVSILFFGGMKRLQSLLFGVP